MPSKRQAVERLKSMGKTIATRRAIQDCFLSELQNSEDWNQPGDREPWGCQTRVTKKVNTMKYGDEVMKTNRETVRQWMEKVRQNDYSVMEKL